MEVNNKPVLLGVKEVGEMVGRDRSTIIQWNHAHRLPKPDYKISGVPIWLEETIDQWILKSKIKSTGI